MEDNIVDKLIKRILNVTGISSQSDLAKALKINRSGITHARNKNKIPEKWIIRLCREFGLSPRWIETGQGNIFIDKEISNNIEFKQIPKVAARLSAGTGSFEIDDEVTDYVAFKSKWLAKKGSAKNMVVMEVFGNSMEPEIREGDNVLIDQSQKDIIAGAIYAVGIEDTILIKRIEKRPNKLVLCSDNHDYSPIHLSKEELNSVKVIGKVVWICREYR